MQHVASTTKLGEESGGWDQEFCRGIFLDAVGMYSVFSMVAGSSCLPHIPWPCA